MTNISIKIMCLVTQWLRVTSMVILISITTTTKAIKTRYTQMSTRHTLETNALINGEKTTVLTCGDRENGRHNSINQVPKAQVNAKERSLGKMIQILMVIEYKIIYWPKVIYMI